MRQKKREFGIKLRLLAIEHLENRRLLAFDNLALVQANETDSSKNELLRYRFGFDQAEWSIRNTISDKRGIGFGASKAFGGKAGALAGVGVFLNDTPLSGDWAGLGNSNIGSARWQSSSINPAKQSWGFHLATDRDEHVDQYYVFPGVFDQVSSNELLPIPLSGNIDGQNGDDLTVVDRPLGSQLLRWRIANELPGPSISYPLTSSSLQEVMFGSINSSPAVGYYRALNGVRQPGISVVSLQGTTATWSILYPDGQGNYSASGETQVISQQLTTSIVNGTWHPIAGDFNGDGTADLGLVEFRSGQLLLHIAGEVQAVVLANNATLGDRIIVGNWSQSQWSSNVFYLSSPSAAEYSWGDGVRWQGSSLPFNPSSLPTPTSDVVIDDRYQGQSVENKILYDGVSRRASTSIIGRAVLQSSSNDFFGPTSFSRLRIEGGVNVFAGPTQISTHQLQGAILSENDAPVPYNSSPLGYAVYATSGTTTFSNRITTAEPVIVTGGSVVFSSGDSQLGILDVRGTGRVELAGNGLIVDLLRIGAGGTVEITGANVSIREISTENGGVLRLKNALFATAGAVVNANGGVIEIESTNQLANRDILVNANGLTITASFANGGATFNNNILLQSNAEVSFDWIGQGSPTVGFTYDGIISGVGGLRKRGANFLNLTNQSNYNGPTIVDAGELLIGQNNAIPSGTTLTIASGAIVNLEDRNDTVPRGLLEVAAINGNGVVQGKVGSRLTIGRTNLNSTFAGRLVSSTSAVADAGSLGLTKVGTGVLTLSGSNTSTGSFEILAGTLTTGAVATLPTVPLSISLGATLDLLGNSQQVGSISGNGNVRGTGGTLIVSGTANVRFDGNLSGAMGVRKQGSGTWTLGASNSFTGGMQVNAGSLLLDALNALGSGSLTVSPGASVDMQQNQQVTTLTNSGTVRANGVTLRISGNLTTTSTAVFENTNGTVQSTGASGEQTLNFGTTRPGNLTIAGGSRVNLQASTESITLAGSLNILAGTLDLNTKVVTTNALTLDGNATLSGTGQLTSNNIAQLMSGVVEIALAGPSGVRKSGSGTVTINTAGVYRGPTTVEQGTLDVQVSQGLGEGSIDVRASGVLLLQGTHSLSQLDNTGRVTAPSATIQLAGNLSNTGSLALGTLETVGSSGTSQQVQLGSGNLDNLTSVDAADVQVSSLAPTLNLSGSLIVRGGSIHLGDEVVSVGRVVINGDNTKEIRGTGSLTSGSAFDLLSGVVAIALRGSSGLTKSTAGTVTLLVGNSFTGPIAIQAGTLIASAPNSIAGTVSTTQGATLDIRGTQGLVSLQNAGRLIANSASLQLSGDFINAGDFQSGTSTLVLNSNGPQTINLGASRAHSITKQGSGITSLQSSDNAITLTGDLTLEQGRMNLGSSVAVSRSFSLDGGSTIEGTGSLTSSSDFTLRSGTVAIALSGSRGITKAGSGTVTLQVPNALTGTTIVIDNGILNATASNSLPAGNLQLAASSTVGVSGTQTVQSIDNLGTINAGTSTIQIRGDFSSPGIFNAASSTLVMNGTGEQRVQFGDNQLNNLTIAGQSNEVRLVSATATLNLTGSLNVRSGSLEADNTAVVSTSFLLDAGNSDTIRGTSTLSSTSTFDLRNGTVEIELTGTAGLRKSSSGTVRLNVSASYQGDSQVIEGSLLLNTPNAIPEQSPIRVGALGAVDFGNFSADIHSISNQGNVQVGEAELSLTNDLINESSGTFTTGTTTLNLNGNLLNQGSWPSANASITWEGTSESQRLFSNNATFSNLVKSSTGELIVEDLASVEGEYRQLSGDLRLTAGDLSVGTFVWNQGELNSDSTAQAFGINIRNSATFEAGNLNAPIQGGSVWTKVGSGVVTFSATIAYDLQLQVDGGEVNVTQNASLPEKRDLSIASSAVLRVQSGSTTFANVDIAGDLLVGRSTLVVQPIARINQTVAENSVVTGTVSGSSGLLKLGLGTLTWSGVNQITGVYEIDGGNFELMSDSALASESSLVINGLAKVKVVSSNVGNSSLSGEGELSVDTRSQVVTRGGSFSGVLSGAGNIIKQGQDNLELTSQSRGGFNGNLSVQAGSLIVNGDLSSAKTNVENGASLRGAGRLGETIILRGGTLSPGNSPGRMTLASLDLEPGASLVVELEGRQAGETYDQLVVVGDARLDGNWVVEIDQTLRGSLSPVDFFDLVTFQTMSGTPSLSFPTDLGNLAIRPLVLANSYRLIVEAPTPPPNGSGQNPTDDSEDADSPKDEGNGTTRLVGVANREERVNSIILSVSKKDVGSNKQYSHAGDPSDTLVPPISKVISEADAAVAAIDKVLADGVSMEEAPAVIADVKPIRIDELEIPEFPKPSSIDRKVEFPEWIEADQTNSTRRIVAVASGITTTLIGLGLAWFAYRRTKQSQGREQELEHTSIGQPLNRSNTGSPSKKTESSNSNAKEDTLWTNS